MKQVLLVGGTSETAALAESLAGEGHAVLVCTATDLPLATGDHPAIRRRCGRMTAEAFEELMRSERIDVVVNAAHPFAEGVRAATRAAAGRAGLPHVEFMRPGLGAVAESEETGVCWASDHEEAAERAVAAGGRILLTIGVNHLAVYADAARRGQRELMARVLPREESIAACRAAGLREQQIITARGTPSVDDTEAVIRKHGIRVLVTKESGAAGGVPEKLEAARRAGCAVVIVRRPEAAAEGCASAVPALVERVREALRGRG